MSFACDSYVILMSFVCQSYVLVCHSYAISMSLAWTHMSFACHSYVLVYYLHVLVCHLYVIRMYSYAVCRSLVCHPFVNRIYLFVIRVSLVCTGMYWYDIRMLFVCTHSHVLVCHPYVTRVWFYHEPSFYTDLFTLKSYEICCHSGVNAILNLLRTKFWIICGWQTVKNSLKKCVTCKSVQGKNIMRLKMLGSITLDHFLEKINENSHKRYILLFTCAVTRVIHLESWRYVKADFY